MNHISKFNFYDHIIGVMTDIEISQNGILINQLKILAKDIKFFKFYHEYNYILFDIHFQNQILTLKTKNFEFQKFITLFVNYFTKNIIANIISEINEKGKFNINNKIEFSSNGVFLLFLTNNKNKLSIDETYIEYENLEFIENAHSMIIYDREKHKESLITHSLEYVQIDNFLFLSNLLKELIQQHPIGNKKSIFETDYDSAIQNINKNNSIDLFIGNGKYSKSLLFCLTFLFSPLGIHRFYIGNNYLGILIPFIIGLFGKQGILIMLFEIVAILTNHFYNNFNNSYQKYLKNRNYLLYCILAGFLFFMIGLILNKNIFN